MARTRSQQYPEIRQRILDKAAELFGNGTQSIRWITTNHDQQMDVDALERQQREQRLTQGKGPPTGP